MKNLKNIALMLMLAVFAVSCVEKEPDYRNFPTKDVDFAFTVDGDEYQRDFYYVSTLQFTNTSAKSGAPTWDFGDGTTSNEANPTHKYAKSGQYNVTLTLDGVGSRTYPIMIMDIAPLMSVVAQSADTVVINDVTIDLGIELPNPDNLTCKYIWKFPEGTTLADGSVITEFEGYSHEDGSIDNPGSLRFKNIGSQKIEVQTYFDINGENRRLDDSYVNVQVGYTEEVPTLYYANHGGNIKAYKLIPEGTLPEGTKNGPFDMGVSSGVTPQQILFKAVKDATTGETTDYIFILDCGKNYIYQNDTDGVLGDGKITVMSADGSYANIMITNVGGHAFSDPFQGCTDDEFLYYTDRNAGISRISLNTRGAQESRVYDETAGYMVMNNQLGYYGRGIAYGAIHTGLAVDASGVFYWAKRYNGTGIYRFTTSDIGVTDKLNHPILLAGVMPKAMTIDEARKHMYVWHAAGTTPGAGFSQYPLVGLEETLTVKDYTAYVKMDASPINSTADEGLYVTQFALDSATGNVYFGFNALTEGADGYTSGIKYYDYATKTIKSLEGNSDKVLGICINPRKTKLF